MNGVATPPVASVPSLAGMIHEPGRAASAEHFQRALTTATGSTELAAVREAASQFVSSAFVVPVLNALRESPFNDGPFSPGAAERRFGPLLDQHLADNVVKGANFTLIDSITERAMRASAVAAYSGYGGT